MESIKKEFSTKFKKEAIENNLFNFYKTLAEISGEAIYDEGDVVWTKATPYYIFNAKFEEEGADARVSEILNMIDKGEAPRGWLVGPSSKPSNLGKRLLKNGFQLRQQWCGMAMDLAELQREYSLPPEVEIIKVQDQNSMRDWVHVVNLAMFGGSGVDINLHTQMSNRQNVGYYLLYINGKPSSTSMLFISDGVVGIYMVSTLSCYRDRGFGTAVTRAPLLDAESLGCSLGVLEATKLGEGIYRRLGFKDYCQFYVYNKNSSWTGI